MSETTIPEDTFDAICADCGMKPHRALEFYAPDGQEKESWEVFKKAIGGAVLGGVNGAVLGPQAIPLGMAGGAVTLGYREVKAEDAQGDRSQVDIECTECGCERQIELELTEEGVTVDETHPE